MNRMLPEDLKVGLWVWTVSWRNTNGGVRANLGDPDRDWYISYGEIIFVGERLIVLRNVEDGYFGEWEHNKEGLIFEFAWQVQKFFADEWKFSWANEEYAQNLESIKDSRYYHVACSKHGHYDSDELCWCCHNKLLKEELEKNQ